MNSGFKDFLHLARLERVKEAVQASAKLGWEPSIDVTELTELDQRISQLEHGLGISEARKCAAHSPRQPKV